MRRDATRRDLVDTEQAHVKATFILTKLNITLKVSSNIPAFNEIKLYARWSPWQLFSSAHIRATSLCRCHSQYPPNAPAINRPIRGCSLSL